MPPKAPIKKAPTKKAPVKKTPVKEAEAPEVTETPEAPVKKASAPKKAPAKKAPAKATAPKKEAPAKKEAPKKAEVGEVKESGEGTVVKDTVVATKTDVQLVLSDSMAIEVTLEGEHTAQSAFEEVKANPTLIPSDYYLPNLDVIKLVILKDK